MNYFKLIQAFYDLQLLNPLTTGQIALWNALAYINNKCAWSEWFNAANQTLELMTGLNRSTIYRNRNILKQLGLIDFKINGAKACKYKVIDITTNYNIPNMQQEMQQEMHGVCTEYATVDAPSMQQGTHTLNNITKTKLNNNISILTNTSSSDLDTVPTHADEIKTDGLAEDVNSEKENMDDIKLNNSKISYETMVSLWNSLGLTKIQGINNARKTMLNARLKEYGQDSFDKCIENIKNSSFLRGQNKKGWTITFDWLIKPNNYVKVFENTYADKMNNENSIQSKQKSYVNTPTLTGIELEEFILNKSDLDDF